jgi:D-ribulokinase
LLAARSEEPVLLGAAILGSIAGGAFPNMHSAMAALSVTDHVYHPAGGKNAVVHDARYWAFTQVQELARKIR